MSGTDGSLCAERCEAGSVAWIGSPDLLAAAGVLVAFSERTGGASAAPYASLNLAAHVGDDPAAVDENRERLFAALGIADLRDRLVTAEQVHGDRVAEVAGADAGRGAYASRGPGPVPATDALLTAAEGVPLMLLFADCVPVVIVAAGPVRTVAVAHAGWRGAAAGIAGKTAAAVAAKAGCTPSDLLAIMGPRIGPCHYEVGPEVLSHFAGRSATMRAARGRLDLGATVADDLRSAGLRPGNVLLTDVCTAETTDRFYSYRAEGETGRHAAIAVLTDLDR